MASGLIALFDDIAVIARSAAASLDDIAAATATAGTKAAGVVIDDAAVTPRYVAGLSPERELPIIAKIAVGSLRNKLLILLPISLLLSAFLPFAITPLLMLGGAYLAFEATEKLVELALHDHHDEAELAECDTPEELEARQVAGAIRTDLILSAEIMAISLASLAGRTIVNQAIILAIVGVAITVGVYGAVALVVKLDDIGLHLARRGTPFARRFGLALVHLVPWLLTGLSSIGTAAMLWVGGGILVHGMDELGFDAIPHAIHDLAAKLAGDHIASGPLEWLVNALAAALVALVIGGLLVLALRLARNSRQSGNPAPQPPAS
jgi:predicted DNA repair protein MutK